MNIEDILVRVVKLDTKGVVVFWYIIIDAGYPEEYSFMSNTYIYRVYSIAWPDLQEPAFVVDML